MNKRYILGIVLFLIFSCPLFSQVKTKTTKEKAKIERRSPQKNTTKVNDNPKEVIENNKNGDREVRRISQYAPEAPTLPTSIVQVETAIPAFIGYTEKGPSRPTKISSMDAYRVKFGGVSNEDIGVFQINKDGSITSSILLNTPKYMMYYMLELYFANGGGECLITSVGHYNNENSIRNEDQLNGLALLENEDAPTLILFPDATSSKNSGNPAELYKAALAQCAEKKDRFLICDVVTANGDIREAIEKFRFGMGTENLKYGAAYFPALETTLNYQYSENKIQVKLKDHPKTLALRHTESIISNDPNKTETSLYHVENGAYRAQYQQIRQIISAKYLELPPSAAVAGIYVKTDETRGVWKAPANASLNKVRAPKFEIDNNTQDMLNVDRSGKSINAIRSISGKGVVVWGARTMAGNNNDWRYIPVTRLGMTIETSVKKALVGFNTSANTQNTWYKVKAMIENYLNDLWRNGALSGVKPEQAYYVRVGEGQTMTQQDVNQGKLIVEIGIATVRPAEFSVLRITQDMGTN